MKRHWQPFCFIFIIVFLILTRFIWLDRFPPGMNHDELEFILSSKTYSLFGTDLSGYGLPLSLFKTETLGQISAIPPLIMSLFWFVLLLTYTTARIPHILLNIATAMSLGFLANFLFKNKKVSFIAIILFLLNPWSFYLSRYAVDTPFSLFFYVLGITLFLYLNGWEIVLPLLLFVFSFFSYIAAKVLFFPIVLISLIYKLTLKKLNKETINYSLIILGITIIFIIGYFFIASRVSDTTISSRASEVIFFDNETLAKDVDLLRNQSILSPIKNLYINKITESMRIFTSNYLSALSPQLLFSTGENLYNHGLFYIFDFILFLVGAFYMLKDNKKEMIFLSVLILISIIPTAISQHGQSVINRSFFLLPMVIIFMAYGLFEIFNRLKIKTSFRLSVLLISTILLISFSRFLFSYFYQLPVLTQENSLLSSRVLAKYLVLEKKLKKKITVISNEPRQLYLYMVFQLSPDEQKRSLNENKKNHKYNESFNFENITLTKKCPSKFTPEDEYILESLFGKCSPGEKITYLIVNQRDAGDIFKIYNGKLCEGLNLTRWRDEHLLSDYSIENMDIRTFCKRWIAKPD